MCKRILLDFWAWGFILINVRAAGQDFLLPKIDHIARLAYPPSCWLFSQTINVLRVADWAYLNELLT
jgi:hypothetical protein